MPSIFLIDYSGAILSEREVLSNIVTLPHPSSSAPCSFLIIDNNLMEIQLAEHADKSWFVGNNVLEDGNFYVVTKEDPLFLLLPLLFKSKATYSPLSQLIGSMVSKFPDFPLLMKVNNLNLDLVCDVKTFDDDDDMILVRLNLDKVSSYLKAKHTSLSKALNDMNLAKPSAAHANGFVVSSVQVNEKANNDTVPREIQIQAMHMISDYLNTDFSSTFTSSLNLTTVGVENEEKESKKRAWGEEDPIDKMRMLTHGTGAKQETKKVEVKSKKSKLDPTGCKKISSFFSKKV